MTESPNTVYVVAFFERERFKEPSLARAAFVSKDAAEEYASKAMSEEGHFQAQVCKLYLNFKQ